MIRVSFPVTGQGVGLRWFRCIAICCARKLLLTVSQFAPALARGNGLVVQLGPSLHPARSRATPLGQF